MLDANRQTTYTGERDMGELFLIPIVFYKAEILLLILIIAIVKLIKRKKSLKTPVIMLLSLPFLAYFMFFHSVVSPPVITAQDLPMIKEKLGSVDAESFYHKKTKYEIYVENKGINSAKYIKNYDYGKKQNGIEFSIEVYDYFEDIDEETVESHFEKGMDSVYLYEEFLQRKAESQILKGEIYGIEYLITPTVMSNWFEGGDYSGIIKLKYDRRFVEIKYYAKSIVPVLGYVIYFKPRSVDIFKMFENQNTDNIAVSE